MKLVFEDINGGNHKTMYKIGDDLRQDQLITSFFSLFEDIWLDSGLDLRMRYFQVIPTAKSRGFIELVDDSVTLREIQSGVDGSISMRIVQNSSIISHFRESLRLTRNLWAINQYICKVKLTIASLANTQQTI